MRTLTVIESLSLDGVMQAPGGPDEDRRGGFEHGGWAAPYNDDVMAREMGKGMGRTELLLGRRTWELLRDAWSQRTDPNPFTEVLNATRKHVASRTLHEPLSWQNSVLLDGGAAQAVPRLKAEDGPDLGVLGSGDLVRSLMASGLVDTWLLLIHPLVLGSGRRLFPDGGGLDRLELVDSVTTTKGVLIATYRPASA